MCRGDLEWLPGCHGSGPLQQMQRGLEPDEVEVRSCIIREGVSDGDCGDTRIAHAMPAV